MTLDEAHTAYIAEIDQPHGKIYAETVGRFQEGFLADRVTDHCDEAFRRAVDVCARLLPIIKIKASA